MKIYLVVEEFNENKRVVTCWKDYDHPDYSHEGTKDLCKRMIELYKGAKYYVKEVEL